MTENKPNNAVSTKALVAIRCITYNHEAYIRDALEGFIMQKTNFPFVAIVHDDASTDGTADIIREYAAKYPDIIKPIYETENQYSKHDGSLGRIMTAACEATGAKYIAMCEGDGYWTDPLKLQKQVDFLETHPDYGAIYGRVQIFSQINLKFETEWGGPNEKFEQLLSNNTIPTPTVLIRNELYIKYTSFISSIKQTWKMGDYPLWLFIAINSKIKYSANVVAVYRVLSESASHSKSDIQNYSFLISLYDIKLWFAQNNPKIQIEKNLYQKWELIRQELKIRLSLKTKGDIKSELAQLNSLLTNYIGIPPRRFMIFKYIPTFAPCILYLYDYIHKLVLHYDYANHTNTMH